MTPYADSLRALGDLELGVYAHAILECLRPRPTLTPVAWAQTHRRLSAGEQAGGRYSLERFPYWREIINTAADDSVRQLTVMGASQIAKTTSLETMVGFWVHQDASDVIVVLPAEEAARDFSKNRVGRMVSLSPSLRDVFSSTKKDEESTILVKRARSGALLTFASAMSPIQLAARSSRIAVCDEVDKYPPASESEGSILAQARQRTVSYGPRAKFYCFSSPREAETSLIFPLFQEGDQRHWEVPCFRCGCYQTGGLRFENLIWKNEAGELDLDDVHMRCLHCAGRMEAHERAAMVKQGHWVVSNPTGTHPSYHITGLLGPVESWRDIAEAWSSASAARDIGRMQAVWGLKVGLPWESIETKISAGSLEKNVCDYDAPAPTGSLLITIGADVQSNRIEAVAVAYGEGKESWLLEHLVFPGDTLNMTSTGPWAAFSNFLGRTWKRIDGSALGIACCFVDAGFRTSEVNGFTREQMRLARNVFPSHGVGGPHRPIVDRPKLNSLRSPSFAIGTDACKETLFARLSLTETEGPGVIHIARSEMFGEAFVRSLVSERRVLRRGKHVWLKTTRANEALDCACLSIAALEYVLTQHPGLLQPGAAPAPRSRRRILHGGVE